MKCVHKGLILTLALVPLATNAESLLANNEVKYLGDNTARQVCESVVNDDSARLNKVLNNYRGTLVYRYHFTNNQAVSGDFACNNRSLLDFADKIDAQNISNYLRAGVVTMEELVSYQD